MGFFFLIGLHTSLLGLTIAFGVQTDLSQAFKHQSHAPNIDLGQQYRWLERTRGSLEP